MTKIRKQIGDKLNKLTPEARSSAGKVYGFFKDKVQSSISEPLLKKEQNILNEKFTLLKDTLSVLNPAIESLDRTSRKKVEITLANLADQLGDVKNLGSQRVFGEFFDNMQKIDPQMINPIKNKIMETAKKLDLNLHYMGVDPSQSGSISRLVGAVEQAGLRVARATGVGISWLGKLKDLPGDQLQALANQSQKVSPKLGNFLNNLANVKNPQRKAALLFSASQKPDLSSQIEALFLTKEDE